MTSHGLNHNQISQPRAGNYIRNLRYRFELSVDLCVNLESLTGMIATWGSVKWQWVVPPLPKNPNHEERILIRASGPLVALVNILRVVSADSEHH